VFPPPLAISIDGTPSLGPSGFSATFDGLPDVPLAKLEVRIAGGPQSVFTGSALCTGSHALLGSLAAHSGAVAQLRSPIAVSGCKPVVPTASASLRGTGGPRPRLGVKLRVPAAAPALRTVNLHLPRGLSVGSRALGRSLRVTAGGKRVRGAARRRGNGVRIVLPAPGSRSVTVTLRRPALRVSRALARRVRAGKRATLRLTVAVRDARGGIVSVHPRARAR
jgi:hypothetical protein